MAQLLEIGGLFVRHAYLISLVIPLSWAFASAPVHAASRQARERAARKACLVGDYVKGVSILSDLFLDTKDPNLIYNQGRCLEQNRRYEDAIARFQEYLRVATKASADDKAEAEKHIAACQALLAKQAGQVALPSASGLPATGATAPQSAPAPQPPVQWLPMPAQPPVMLVQPAPAAGTLQQPPPAPAPGLGLRTAGITTAAVGAAALVAGIIVNVKVNGMASDMETTPGGYSPGKESDRKSYEALGWAGYGVGAACVATGVVLYFLGLRAAWRSSSPVALVPALAPGQAGARVTGAF